MRNEMQQIRMLSELLETTDDPNEIEKLEAEIADLEDALEIMADNEYKTHHNSRYLDY
jgi:hypothetical protein